MATKIAGINTATSAVPTKSALNIQSPAKITNPTAANAVSNAKTNAVDSVATPAGTTPSNTKTRGNTVQNPTQGEEKTETKKWTDPSTWGPVLEVMVLLRLKNRRKRTGGLAISVLIRTLLIRCFRPSSGRRTIKILWPVPGLTVMLISARSTI